MRRLTAALALVTLVGPAVLAGCGQPSDPELEKPFAAETRTGVIGRTEDLFGVKFNMNDLTVFSQSPTAFPRLRLAVRSENTSGRDQQNPDVQLVCDESPQGGDWYSGSTWEPNGLLANGLVNQGEVIVGFPRKPQNPRYVVPDCTAAHVSVIATDPGNGGTLTVNYPVGADLIAEAVRAPIGPGRPLPDRAS